MTRPERIIPPPARNMSAEELQAKAELARSAASAWRRYSLSDRVSLIRQFWEGIRLGHDELARIIEDEIGRPPLETQMLELSGADILVRYYCANAHRILQEHPVWRPWLFLNKRAYVRYHPYGLIGLITPWNFPFILAATDAVAAMLAGNAVLIKPSEHVWRTAVWLENKARSSGLFPEGLISVALGDGSAGNFTVSQADMIVFTGSPGVGREVASHAAARLKPAVLELGGKHPMIVLEDAPLERAARAAVWGAFANSGQLCIGVERAFVHESVYQTFTEAVRKGLQALRQSLKGRERDLGRLALKPQLERIKDQLEDARSKGARVIGGEILDEENLMMAPALVLEATPDMKLMHDETFGPVLPVMKIGRAEEGLRLANLSPLGLSASIWSSDLSKAESLAASVEAGMVSVNDLVTHYSIATLPFGGIKGSGLGRRHGDEGLRMFCWQQSVCVHEWPSQSPDLWWFPYDAFKAKILRWVSGWA
ncbi:MAG: aldehyde dehydrogenase family protein [Elusimicrobia bacterium]|nr:aldehyde dehydrogenase family protein [Elusimicrobiota bacterium]